MATKRTNRRIRGIPEDAQADLNEVITQLSARLEKLESKPVEQPTQHADFIAREEQTITVEAPSTGVNGVLVQSTPFNKGKRVTFIQKNANPVTFRAISGTVNGASQVISNLAGTYQAISDGEGGWALDQGIGPSGIPGAPGTPGAAGRVGAQGPPGRSGMDGRQGPPGAPGSAGVAGAAGATGPAGAPIPGRSGADGRMGFPGAPGVAGVSGAAGAAGSAGPPGRYGADGRMGPPGPPGPTGPAGSGGGGTSAVATAVVTLAPSPGTLSGTFTITSSGLTALQQIPVWLAVDSTDPTEAEEQIIFSGVASSATNINVYWQSVDGTPKIGNRTVAFIPTSGALLSVVGSGNAITVSSVVDLTGSTSTLNLTPTAGDLNVYDISTVQCGGTVTFQSLTATNIDGFSVKNDGFFFFLNIRDATTSDYLTLTENNGNTTTSIRTPAARGHRMTKNDSVMVYYSNSRWRVCETVPKLWMVSSDNVTFAATQNNYARGDRGSAYMRITLTGSQSITGVVPDGDAEGFPGGEILAIQNIDGTDEIILPHADTGSTATNRWSMPIGLDRTVPPGECAMFRHDGTSDRWRMIASSVDARVLQRVCRITTGAFGATIDPAVTWIRLIGQAGGGGGGGAQAALLREAAAGAGGAGGGYYDIWIPAVAGGGAVSGSVGNGGNGGSTGGGAGSPGGDTTLTYNGVTYTAFGGGGGVGVTSGNGANSAGQLVNMSLGGQGGDSDQTDFEILSGYGGWGMMYAGAAMTSMLAKGGDGGSTFWGNGGIGGLVVGIEAIAPASTGGAYGTGGGGGAKIKNAAGATAGQGGNSGVTGIGMIIMYAGPVPTTGIS